MKRFHVFLIILSFFMLGSMVQGQDATVEKGEIDGASFRIQIPTDWNKGLVMYAHGYRPREGIWNPLSNAMCAVFLKRGFALAESGYSRQGWALEEAVRETEALRRYFVKKHGETGEVYVAGHSMGGAIALAIIEQYPKAYEGALTMCSPLIPAVQFFKNPMFDMLVTFEALFGTALSKAFKPVVEVPALSVKAVDDALESDPELAIRLAQHWGMRRADLPKIIAQYHLLYCELKDRAGGNFIDNRNTVYVGFEPIRELKADVPRYAADPEALAYVRKYYTPTGVLEDPVLAVHTIYDPGVPPRLANFYDITVSLQGCEKWFVHRYVEAEGHCNISPDLTGKAFDALRNWAVKGVRPEAGLLR